MYYFGHFLLNMRKENSRVDVKLSVNNQPKLYFEICSRKSSYNRTVIYRLKGLG